MAEAVGDAVTVGDATAVGDGGVVTCVWSAAVVDGEPPTPLATITMIAIATAVPALIPPISQSRRRRCASWYPYRLAGSWPSGPPGTCQASLPRNSTCVPSAPAPPVGCPPFGSIDVAPQPSATVGATGPWTAGESAVAGQVNGGQTTWYGEACSGPLPAQYNYTGASDLENTATNVASTLGNAYYTALDHTSAPVLSQPVSVSGHAGWEIEYQVTYTNAAAQGATWTSEEGAVVVADTGAGNTPVVFFASVPNTLGATTVDSLVSSLQLTVVPNPSGADGSPAPGGSPGD